MVPYLKLPRPILNAGNISFKDRFLEGIVISIPFRYLCDLKFQNQLIDIKMMVESKAVAVVTLLMV